MFTSFYTSSNFFAKSFLFAALAATLTSLAFDSTFLVTLYMVFGITFASCIDPKRGFAAFGFFVFMMIIAGASVVISACAAALIPDINDKIGADVVGFVTAILFALNGSYCLRKAFIHVKAKKGGVK